MSDEFDPNDDDPETVDALIEQRDHWRDVALSHAALLRDLWAIDSNWPGDTPASLLLRWTAIANGEES